MRLMFCQELVDTDGDLPLVHFYAEVLVELSVIGWFSDVQQALVFQLYVVYDSAHGSVTSSNSSTLSAPINCWSPIPDST